MRFEAAILERPLVIQRQRDTDGHQLLSRVCIAAILLNINGRNTAQHQGWSHPTWPPWANYACQMRYPVRFHISGFFLYRRQSMT